MPTTVEALGVSIALQRRPADVMRMAVELGALVPGADVAFAAVAEDDGAFAVRYTYGTRDPRLTGLRVRAGVGLGGRVLETGRPLAVADYAADPRTREHADVIAGGEGLRGLACVPVAGAADVEALLYAGAHAGALGRRALGTLEVLAGYVRLGLDTIRERRRERELVRVAERQRLATALHDTVAQTLFALGTAAQRAQETDDGAELQRRLTEIETTAARARRELRETIAALAEAAPEAAFDVRLEGRIRLFQEQTGCAVRVIRRGRLRAVPQPVEQLLVDTALEGLRNGVKHAGSRLAVVHLGYGDEAVVLAIQTDDDVQVRPPAGGGTGAGLRVLRSRAEQLRGHLELRRQPGGLTALRLEVPLT